MAAIFLLMTPLCKTFKEIIANISSPKVHLVQVLLFHKFWNVCYSRDPIEAEIPSTVNFPILL